MCLLVEPRRYFHLLDIRALIADHLLGHLEAPWAQLGGPHLLPTVAFPFAGSLPRHRLVSNDLRNAYTHQLPSCVSQPLAPSTDQGSAHVPGRKLPSVKLSLRETYVKLTEVFEELQISPTQE